MHTDSYINKKNFGYSVSIGETYAAIGNPSFDTFSSSSSCVVEEGSVDIYKLNTFIHDKFEYLKTIKNASFSDYILYSESETSILTTHDSIRNWQDLAISDNGANVVAVVASGFIYTSADSGSTWVARDSARAWRSVASSTDGSRLAAVAYSGFIYTSSDSGVTWVPRDSARTWTGIAMSDDGSKLVACAELDYLYVSSDYGVNWIPKGPATSPQYTGVASSNDGVNLVAVATAGAGYIYTSNDSGLTWVQRGSLGSWKCVASSGDGSKLVAGIFLGFLYTSTDYGVTWTPRATSQVWWSVTSSDSGNVLWAIANNGLIHRSADSGVTWDVANTTVLFWQALCVSSDESVIVVAEYGGSLYTLSYLGDLYLETEINTLSNIDSSSYDASPLLISSYNDIKILQSDFGRSVDICDSTCAIASTKVVYVLLHTEDIVRISEGVVEIHDLSKTSSLIYSIYPSDVPSTFYTGSYSFGWSVSINDDFLAVGSPYTINSGSVFLFKSSSVGYTFHSRLTGSAPSDSLYGSCIKLDKSYNKLVVGNGSIVNNTGRAYLYEFISSSNLWVESKYFVSDREGENLNFVEVPQYDSVFTLPDGFGNSVSIYCSSSSDTTVVIGSPYDRIYKEYSGSSCYRNGCVYVFDSVSCSLSGSSSSFWNQTKLFGDEDAFKYNRFGHSVDLDGDNLLISSPKFLSEFSSSYIQNTLFKANDCNSTSEDDFLGMFYIYQKSNGSWDNIYSKFKPRKKYGHPHCFFAHGVSIKNSNVIVGSPVAIVDTNRILSTPIFSYVNGGFNIFNISDYEAHHHVGNVFYKTGKMVISTSGSIFDDMFKSDVSDEPIYDISYNSKEQIYEKEIICTVLPGEFNYSTNPTSYYYPEFILDLNKNGKFDFSDCDKILRAIYRKLSGSETWWELFPFDYPETSGEIVEKSLFYYNLSSSFKNVSQVYLRDSILSDDEYNHIVDNLNISLDINSDGITDLLDLSIIWKYFSNGLTPDVYSKMISAVSVEGGRSDYSTVKDYLDSITGKNSVPTIIDNFQTRWISGSFNSTGSYLSPYITSIGLYNGLDLIALAKLGTPIKNEGIFPLNFIVRFDI